MNIQGLQTYSRQLAWEVINNYPADHDQHDAIHEQVDGSELVIYYHKAWETVQNTRTGDWELFARAESMREDCGMESSRIDVIMTQLAYCILYIMTTEALDNQKESVERYFPPCKA